MATVAEKYATKFEPRKTGNFVTDEIIVCGNGDSGEIYIRDYNVFALAISNELDLGNVVTRNTGNDVNEIPYFITDNTGAGIVKHIASGGLMAVSENTAFNKNFGSSGTSNNVAREDHVHNELIVLNAYQYGEFVTTDVGQTTVTIDANNILAVFPAGSTYVSPELTVSVYSKSGTNASLVNIPSDDLIIKMIAHTVTTGTAYSLDEIEIRNLTASTSYMISVVCRSGRLTLLTGGGSRGE